MTSSVSPLAAGAGCEALVVRSHQPHELGVNLTACFVIVHLHGGKIEAAAIALKSRR